LVFEADFESKLIAPPPEVTKLRQAKGISYILEYMLAFVDARRELEIELIELELLTVPTELTDNDVGRVTSTIKSVSLASNKLSILPSDMYSLDALAALDLSENNIHELPEGFVEMRMLEALYLDDNKLRTVPVDFGRLKKLRYVSLNRNRLTTFPPSIRKCKQLQVLRADRNKFSILPQTLSLCQTLKEMSFSDNAIETIPMLFNKMKGLRKLFLERNKLETIPQVFMQWTSLTALHLKGNQLVTLPLNFTGLLKIKLAEFDWDHLILPPPEVAQQGNKVVLDYLYQMTIALKRLRLDLSEKGLVGFPVHLTSMERLTLLNLNANKIRLLEPYVNSLKQIKTLSLDYNMMPSVPKEFCHLTLLTELSITNNNLQMLPHDLGKLTGLTSLKLQSNALVELPANFTDLVNLTYLSLRYNRLKALPHNIGGSDYSLGPFVPIFVGGLRELEYFDASNNDLEVVPKSILGLTNLTTLFLDQNPLKSIPDRLKRLKKCDTFTIAIEKLTVLEKLDLYKLDVKVVPPKEVVMRGNETLASFYKKILKVGRIKVKLKYFYQNEEKISSYSHCATENHPG